ncbi:MAG: hypothetical protein ACO1OB_29150 [Archangium sp.]
MPAFLSAFVLALAASGSVASARLAHGTHVTLAWTVAELFGVLLVWSSTTKQDRWGSSVAAQFAGATLGSLIAHTLLITGDAALVESAPQWVNDFVFITALVIAAWSVKRGSALAMLSAALLLAYNFTAPWWHVDHFAGSFVQDFVVARTIAVALGLLVFDVIWSGRELSS